jgi:hypothetical protein
MELGLKWGAGEGSEFSVKRISPAPRAGRAGGRVSDIYTSGSQKSTYVIR